MLYNNPTRLMPDAKDKNQPRSTNKPTGEPTRKPTGEPTGEPNGEPNGEPPAIEQEAPASDISEYHYILGRSSKSDRRSNCIIG
jgi:hypothetical protein